MSGRSSAFRASARARWFCVALLLAATASRAVQARAQGPEGADGDSVAAAAAAAAASIPEPEPTGAPAPTPEPDATPSALEQALQTDTLPKVATPPDSNVTTTPAPPAAPAGAARAAAPADSARAARAATRRAATGVPRGGPGAPADTLAAAGDTLSGDALYQKLAGESRPGQIVYKGEELTLYPSDKVILLSGSAEARQDSSLLSANRISYVRDENIVEAFGQASVQRGTNSMQADTLFYDQGSGYVSTFGPSTLKEGAQQVLGSNLKYSLDRKSGILTTGRTEYDRWFLRGQDMNKIGEKTFVVRGGTFTTDPAEVPDYHFGAKQIKLRQDDVIIARPVVLYVSDVPIFYLPWYLEPLGTGRKSGILRPNIGLNTLINAGGNERNVQNLGYYWAINEYMDAQAALDWFSESRTVLRFDFRYALRYLLRGSAHYEQVWNRDIDRKDTLFRLSHDHDFNPNTSLRVDANVSSSRNFFERNSFDPNRLTQRSLRSNASFNRRLAWGSLTLGAFSDFQLQQQQTDWKIPQLQLSLNTRPLFPTARLDQGGWKRNLQIGASTSFDYDYTTRGDTLSGQDSTVTNQQTSVTRATLSGPFDLLGFIKTNPSIDFTETLFNNHALPDSLADESGFAHLETFGAGLSFAANIFRVFQGGPGPVTKVRHTFGPSVSFRYQPATTPREDLPFGFPGGGGVQVMNANFAIANDLDLKIRETKAQADRRSEEEDRIRRAREAGLIKAREDLTDEERAVLDSIAVIDSLNQIQYNAVEDSLDQIKDAIEAAQGNVEDVDDLKSLQDSLQAVADSLAAATAQVGDSAALRDVRKYAERQKQTESAAQSAERTVRLLSVTNRFGYDFERAKEPRLLGFSTFSTTVTSGVSSAVSVSLSATHDLTDTHQRDDGIEESFSPFLQSLNTVVRLGGGRDFPSSSTFTGRPGLGEKSTTSAEAGQGSVAPSVGNELRAESDFDAVQSTGIGRWNVDLTHSWTRQRDADGQQSLRFGTSFKPTRNWSMRYSTGYNITQGAFLDQTVSLVRDMNRWQATLNLNVFPQDPQDRVLVEFAVFLRDVPSLKVPYRVRRE